MNDYLSPLGRLLPSGSCGGVGLSGLTLGGSYGFFARQHGLTCYFLEYVREVTNEGVVINSDDVSELLWACRGGGKWPFWYNYLNAFFHSKATAYFHYSEVPRV